MSEINRIHITGAAGNGKTTLGRQLAERLRAPYYELDLIMYEGGNGSKVPLETRLTRLREICAQPRWITEGSYLWWAIDLFKTADRVIWLDMPWYITIERIITRHIRLSIAGQNRHAGIAKLARFVWRYRQYYMASVPDTPSGLDDDRAGNYLATAQFISAFSHKLIHCRRLDDIDAFVETLAGHR